MIFTIFIGCSDLEIIGQGYQNLINCLLCHNDTKYKAWLDSSRAKFDNSKLFGAGVTLKIRSRSPKSNQLSLSPSLQGIYASLVKIHPLVQKRVCKRSYENVDVDRICTKTNMSPTFGLEEHKKSADENKSMKKYPACKKLRIKQEKAEISIILEL